MAEQPIRGSCLCGKVRYELTPPLGTFQYCHCSRCRKITGSAYASNIFVKPDQIRWHDPGGLLRRYAKPDAKHYATTFCSECGSTLPWLTQTGAVVVVPTGTLDGDPGVRPTQNIFWGSRACWYEAAESLPTYEELPRQRS